LELWLVVLNLLDMIKRFKSNEFHNKLKDYHDRVSDAFKNLMNPSEDIEWDKLEKALTTDLREIKIAASDSGSEFLFYSFAADYTQRIFFSMDIRDLGVELMLDYERSNREVGYHQYSEVDLMEETL